MLPSPDTNILSVTAVGLAGWAEAPGAGGAAEVPGAGGAAGDMSGRTGALEQEGKGIKLSTIVLVASLLKHAS